MARSNVNFETKKLEIIEVCCSLFQKQTFEKTSIQDILNACGISKGAMYHYFLSKEDILDAVVKYLIEKDRVAKCFLYENMEISAMEKLISLLNGSHQDLTPVKVLEAVDHVSKNPNSIFYYKIMDVAMITSIEVIEIVIIQGVNENSFHICNPKGAAEILYHLVMSLFTQLGQPQEKLSLKELNNEELDFEELNFIWYLDLIRQLLGLNEKNLRLLSEAVKQNIKRIRSDQWKPY